MCMEQVRCAGASNFGRVEYMIRLGYDARPLRRSLWRVEGVVVGLGYDARLVKYSECGENCVGVHKGSIKINLEINIKTSGEM